MDLSTKTFVITGATAGIGLATAENLVRQGAAIIGVGRSAERCRAAEKALQQINPDAAVQFLCADLSLQCEVHRLAEEIRGLLTAQGKTALDGLANNAGTFTYWLTLTAEGVEMQWAVNHLAAFLLTHELLPLLEAAPASRVVTVSSGSHYSGRLKWDDPQLRRRYNGLRAYENTKLANVLFTCELNRRIVGHSGLRAFAADPGLVKTDIGMKGTPALVNWIWKLRRSGGITAEETARGIAFLLTDPAIQNSTEPYWKHSLPKRPSGHALDEAAARRLWLLSEQMCGLQPEVQHEAA